MSFQRSRRRAARAFVALAATALASGTVAAQELGGVTSPTGPGSAAPPADIVVTGSRVARPANLVAPVPVTQVSSQDLQEVGLQSLSEVLAQLPQTSNNNVGENTNRFINGAGTQFINLRGLGSYRTLTLVDGIRHVGALSGVNNSGGTSEVDLGTIAPALIDRIDIVTGGSSAAYGADAVAGVANIILKKNYQGGEITVEQGQATEGGKSTFNVDGILGTNFADDRGNITVGIDFQNQAAVRFDQRDYALDDTVWGPNPTGGNPNYITYTGVHQSTRSSTFAPTVATALPGSPAYSLVSTPGGGSVIPFNRGNLIPGLSGSSYGNTGDGYNPVEFNNLEPPNNRKIIDTLIDYKIADDVGPINDIHFFADLKYADSRGGPYADGVTGIPEGTYTNIPIPTTSAYIPANLRTKLAGYTGNTVQNVPGNIAPFFTGAFNSDGSVAFSPTGVGYGGPTFDLRRITADWGLRQSTYDYEYYRSVVGFKGDIFDRFKYDVYFNYGQNNTTFINTDNFVPNIINALDSVNVGGIISCRSTLAFPGNGCVPINPFKVGPLTPAQNAYIHLTTHENDRLTETQFAGDISGDLFSFATPFSGTVAAVGIAFGAEYREEATASRPDSLGLQSLAYIGGNSVGTTDTIGAYKTREFYAETTVPILRDLPGAKAVDFDGAIRFQSVTTTGDDYTWNARGTWAVTDDFKIRGGLAKAVRTPNGDELYSSGGQSFVQLFDPCGGSQGANRAANPIRNVTCAGVPLYTTTPFASSDVIAGNPNLSSETSQNAQIGGVFTPTFLPGLTASVDYFSFLIKNEIVVTDPNTVLLGCYDKNITSDCQFISRNSDGSLGEVQAPYINAGKDRLKGVDFALNYLVPLSDYGVRPFGDDALIDFNFDATWIIDHKLLAVASDPTTSQYLAGTIGFPRVKANIKVGYSEGPFVITALTRYVSEQAINPVVGTGLNTYDNNIVGAQVFEDFYASYNWRNFKFFVGINNAFDIKPPQYPTVFSGGNFGDANGSSYNPGQTAGIIDTTGRYVFGGMTVKF